ATASAIGLASAVEALRSMLGVQLAPPPAAIPTIAVAVAVTSYAATRVRSRRTARDLFILLGAALGTMRVVLGILLRKPAVEVATIPIFAGTSLGAALGLACFAGVARARRLLGRLAVVRAEEVLWTSGLFVTPVALLCALLGARMPSFVSPLL